MSAFKPAPDPGIYLLADHLDAALAAGEDLMAETLAAPADREADAGAVDALPDYVARLARFEAALIARVLQARRRASELPRLEAHMRPVRQLIVSQSESLLTIIDQFGDNAEQRFLSGDDPLAFLRSRGVLSDEAGTLPHFDALKVTDRYKLAGTVEMGPLLDMVAGALDALDIAYDLFATDDAEDDDDADTEADVDGSPADAPPEDSALEADDTDADADTDADTEIDGNGAAAVEVAAAETENAVTPSSLAQALQSLQRAERAH